MCAQPRRLDPGQTPAGSPHMPPNIVADRCQHRLALLEHAPAKQNQLRPISMDQADGQHGPDLQAARQHLPGDRVTTLRGSEERLEVQAGLLCKRAAGEARPRPADRRERRRGGLCLGTPDRATGAAAAIHLHWKVATQGAGLPRLALEQPAAKHGRSANAGPQRNQHNILGVLCRAGANLTQQSQPHIVL